MNIGQPNWEEVEHTLEVGTRLRVRVTQHWPFGIFVEIPNVPFQGLIQITDFKDEGIMTTQVYPQVGSVVEAIVLGFKETGKQIWLGMRPSQLRCSKQGQNLPPLRGEHHAVGPSNQRGFP